MKKIRLLAWFLLVGLFPRIGMSYEVDTHFELAKKAFAASVLGADPDVWSNLGISSKQLFPSSENIKRNPQRLLSDGAKFEDTFDFGTRALNHFFNPVTGKPLTIFNLALPNSTSPDWALEDGGQIDGTFGLGGQDYSYRDAREYFYKALTAADKSDRDKNFGLTFQTLGMVVHHIQDMAQPQHVRNDQHLELSSNTASLLTSAFCTRGPTACALFLGTYYAIKNPSLYEEYTNDKRDRLVYSGYAPVYSANDRLTFDTPRKFWLTDDGKGIAQYTNTNFLSAGTIPTSPPAIDFANKRDFDIQHLMPGTQLRGTVRFYASTVTDRYLPTGPDNPKLNPMAVSASIFDAELEKYASGRKKIFTLNRFNFDVAHAFLIPRAVGYSAGMLNYFFRGKIDFTHDPKQSGAFVIKNLGPEPMEGTFSLYYDSADGTRQPVPGALWNLTIPANGEVGSLFVDHPESPSVAQAGEYTLVFRGNMGGEKVYPAAPAGAVGAVVGKVVRLGAVVIKTYAWTGRYDTYSSVDLGRTWQHMDTHSDLSGSPIQYVGNNTVLSRDSISTDGGRKWQALERSNSDDIRRLLSAPIDGGLLVGFDVIEDPSRSRLNTFDRAVSRNYGRSWEGVQTVAGLHWSISSPTFIGNGRLIAKSLYPIPCNNCDSARGALFRSTDSGLTWSQLSADSVAPFVYLGKTTSSFNGSLVEDAQGSDTLIGAVLVNGTTPTVMRSVDGGSTWSGLNIPSEIAYSPPGWFVPWYMIYVGNGVILAYFHDQTFEFQHAIYRSSDYGTTWEPAGNLPRGTRYPGVYGMTFVGDNRAVGFVR